MAQHRASLWIHTAEEDGVWVLGLDGSQNGHEVCGLVGGELLVNHFHALGCSGLLEHVSNALAVRSTVVHDGDSLELQGVSSVESQTSAQGVVVGNDTEGGLVAGLGQVGVGGRAGDVRNAAVVVNLGCRDGGTGVQVAHNASNLGIAQFLSGGSALLRISSVVFSNQFKLDLLAADGDTLCVQLFNGHAGAIFVVFAVVSLGAGNRSHVTDLDHLLLCRGNAGNSCDSSNHGQFQLQLHINLQ